MNIQRKNKLSGLVFIACFGLSTSVSSGIIPEQNQGFPSVAGGFGGWNLDNIEVLITDTEYNEIAKLYNPVDGSYTPLMVLGDSFESLIYDGDPATATIMGKLHGKDWPVGEPSGVKVLTDTLEGTGEVMPNGKSDSCIMTTSYDPEGFFLDSLAPAPTTCSSPFQSHKRFKINMQPSMVNDGMGPEESVDMVFNVEHHPTNPNDLHRYQVYQKINNYTDWRLSGYTLEVGFGVGDSFVPRGNAALSLSIGIGENIDKPDPITTLPGDIWDVEQMANFSHGLWGPAGDPKYFEEDGFFSAIRAGYDVDLDESRSVITTVDTLDNVLGSNYETIFGEWLPSRWQPMGILWDEDEDPATDDTLLAYWADYDGDGTYAWTYGLAGSFAIVSPAVVDGWAANPIYYMGHIEDVLNLGLNYNVEVGSILTFPTYDAVTETATFTIRITPKLATADQVEPGWISNPPPALEPTGIAAIVPIVTYLLF